MSYAGREMTMPSPTETHEGFSLLDMALRPLDGVAELLGREPDLLANAGGVTVSYLQWV